MESVDISISKDVELDAGSLSSRRGVSIAVNALNYTVPIKTTAQGEKSKIILNNVTACVKRGRIVGVMGPSGSGKTSFLNAVAGRIRPLLAPHGDVSRERASLKSAVLEGVILYNGHEVPCAGVGMFSSYVMQSDALLNYLTVEETINFAAHLKLKGADKQTIQKRVEMVIQELGLTACRKTIIGGGMKKGISGGQKRRVSIAIELLNDPELIFLDEPTSGLDAALAYDVVKVLRRLADSGRTVVLTIHQPRYQTFSLLQDLIVLCGGKVVYHGEVKDCIAYFHGIGHICPSTFNPADFILDLMTVREGDAETELRQLQSKGSKIIYPGSLDEQHSSLLRAYTNNMDQPSLTDVRESKVIGRIHIALSDLEKLPDQFAASNQHTVMLQELQYELNHVTDIPSKSTGINKKENHFTNWFNEFYILLQRSFLNSSRDPMSTVINCFSLAIFALLAGGMFYDAGYPSDPYDCETVFNCLGVLNFIVINLTFASMGSPCQFPNCRPQLNRELSNGLYHSSSFYCSKMLAELPFQEIPPIIYVTIIYWLAGVTRTFTDYCICCLFGMVAVFSSVSFATFIGTISKSFPISIAITPNVLTIVFLFGGFVVTDDALPGFIDWLKYLSWMRNLFFGIVLTEIGDAPATENCFVMPTKPNSWGNMGIAFAWGVFWRFCGWFGIKYCQTKIGLES